ncbi:hypothetical protein ABID37_001597 [Aquamicrobium terrae]|uniref:Glycoamylase-like domain-containing protein n=2 Tax=Aquamicrobium terrae TaxID=1324945 RepID=A0ABV2MXA3_9HYPH
MAMDAIARDIAFDTLLDDIQFRSFAYFLGATNVGNGLVADSSRPGSPASIAAVGLALSIWPVGVERNWMARAAAGARTLTALRFLWRAPQGPEPDASGYKGFFYHFLDMETGRRAWKSELSTIDTALLMAGVLAAARYFDRDDEAEAEIRNLADALYRRVDWRWALDGGATVSHGWRPERGFLRYRWEGYNEALILYILGLGSPSFPLPPESYRAWLSTLRWRRVYGQELLYAGPLFVHQLSHLWIDFRGIADEFMRARRFDYFENSRAAVYLQRDYAIRNPKGFRGYHAEGWGFSAGDGPGPSRRTVAGVRQRFYGYAARGVPYGPDDGTLSPWAAVASLPFAPQIVEPLVRHYHRSGTGEGERCRFTASFNPTWAGMDDADPGWVSPALVSVNQGPVVLMIENHRSGFPWRLMREAPAIVAGLRQAGFTGGWL